MKADPTFVGLLYNSFMDIITYSDTRERLKDLMGRVIADHKPVAISRRVTLEDRLVYPVSRTGKAQQLEITQAR